MNISRILATAGIAVASLTIAIPAQAHGGGGSRGGSFGGQGGGFGGHWGGFGSHWTGFERHHGDSRGHRRGFDTILYGDSYSGGDYFDGFDNYEPAYDDSLVYRYPFYGYGFADGFTIGFGGHGRGGHRGHAHGGRR